jgi:hypothetical protein
MTLAQNMAALEPAIDSAIDLLAGMIDGEIRAVTNGLFDDTERKRRWLSIRSLQQAQSLMREAMGIVSC